MHYDILLFLLFYKNMTILRLKSITTTSSCQSFDDNTENIRYGTQYTGHKSKLEAAYMLSLVDTVFLKIPSDIRRSDIYIW